MKIIKRSINKWRDMLSPWFKKLNKDVSSPQIDPQTYCNCYQNPHKVFCKHRQAYSKVYMEKHRLWRSSINAEKEESLTRYQGLLLGIAIKIVYSIVGMVDTNINETQQRTQKQTHSNMPS